MSRRKPTPNYQLMFKSAVCALQDAYAEYKKARVKQMQWTFFGNDGRSHIERMVKHGAKRRSRTSVHTMVKEREV